MANLGSGNRTQLSMKVESTFGSNPGGTFDLVRFNTMKFKLNKDVNRSNEILSNRQRRDIRHGFVKVEGSLEAEVAVGVHDALYEGGVAGTWTPGSAIASIGIDAVGNRLTRAAGSFITDGILPGDIVTLSAAGVSGNNGKMRVTAVAAGALTILSTAGQPFAKTLVTDGSTTGSVILTGKRLKSGTTLSTYSFEHAFLDISQYQEFLGVAVDSIEWKIDPKAIAMVTFTVLGKTASVMQNVSFVSGYAAAGSNEPMDAFSGSLWEAGISSGVVTGVTMKLDNSRSVEGVVGSNSTPAIFEGIASLTGKATVFFQDETIYNKFVNETESAIDILLMDKNGTDFLRLVAPRIKYESGDVNAPNVGAIPIEMNFEALEDSVSGTAFYMQRSN